MSPLRKPSSSVTGNIFGTRAPLLAKLRHGRSPNGFKSPVHLSVPVLLLLPTHT